MNIQIKHYGTIKGGKKIYFNQTLYDSQMQSLEGKDFVEIIQEVHRKPSVNSNNYYRGGILPTCYQAEMFSHLDNKDQIHSLYFAPKFLTHIELVNIAGEQKEVTITRSLADLNQEEMTSFITKVKSECNLLGLEIGEPQDYYNKFYNK